MSRFGRDYIQVGYITEIEFPKKGVRFIAVNNSVDSDNPTNNDFTPFLNIMNEWFAKDTSNKIRSVFKSRMKDGKRCSGSRSSRSAFSLPKISTEGGEKHMGVKKEERETIILNKNKERNATRFLLK